MKTKRFVLTYTGAGSMPPADVVELKDHVSVLDQSRCSLLVEDAPEHLDRLLRTLPRWRSRPERFYQPLQRAGAFLVLKNHRRLVITLVVLGLFIAFPLSCQG